MSKIKQLLVAAVFAFPLLITVPVAADDGGCTISNTGPGSNNECTTTENYTCEVQNDNTVIVYNNNEQVAQSGGANGTGNTSVGGATSGSVTNSNGTTFDFTIANEGCEISKVTAPVAPVAPVAETPKTTQGGQGLGAARAKPTVLANTSASDMAPIVLALIATGVIGVLGAGTYAAYAGRR